MDASHLAFLDDAEELEEIRQRSSSGNMLARELKAELLKILQALVAEHQARKKMRLKILLEKT